MEGTLINETTQSQCDMILHHLKKIGAISPLDALREYGCMRLQARIHDIEIKYEIKVKREWGERTNMWGKLIKFRVYSLNPPKDLLEYIERKEQND